MTTIQQQPHIICDQKMAEKALQKVEDDLTCSICLVTYTDPKLLDCHHVFCRKCLKGLARNQEEQLSITCPTCRKVTTVSVEEGVACLQSAFHVNSLLNILSEHKKATKEHTVVTEEQERDDTEEPDMVAEESTEKDQKFAEPAHYCPAHSSRLLDSFCETCDELICIECAFEHHKGHECSLISRLFEKSKKEISSSLRSIESYLQFMQQAVDKIEAQHTKVSEQQDSLVAEVSEYARQIQMAVDTRKAELISRIECISKDKLDDLASQRTKTEKGIIQLSDFLEVTRESLMTSSQEGVVKMKSIVAKETKKIAKSFLRQDSFNPCAKADTVFSARFGTKSVIESFGDVYVSGSPDPAQVRASGDGLVTASIGEKSTVILQTTVPMKESWMKLVPSLECEVISEFAAKKVKCDVQATGGNRHEITYKPTTKGRHQMHIKVKGEHIRGSPFLVNVELPVAKLGRPILTFVTEKPQGIAIYKDGKVVIIGGKKRHYISTFSRRGKRIDCVGYRGFKLPSKLAVDREGNILAVDKEARCIWQLRPDKQSSGKEMQIVKYGDVTEVNKARVGAGFGAGMGLGAGIGAVAGPLGVIIGGAIGAGVGALQQVADTLKLELQCPHNIAFSTKSEKVFVLDETETKQIRRLNSNFTFQRAFGERGDDKGQLNSPRGIVCDRSGKVYVTDTGNNRIQVFTEEGEFVRMFGHVGRAQERVNRPHGITVDSNGIVYVSEPFNHCVSVFTAKGRFVKSFSTLLKDEERHSYGPTDLAVDDQGFLYVCDPLSNKVKVF